MARPVKRDGYRDPGAVTPRETANFENAAQESSSFAHSQEAHRFSLRRLLRGNAATVVFDFQGDSALVPLQAH
jgi:hypothetical protein